jgi:hypothetical protein
MAGLRDQLVADGWTADRFVGFFKAMKADGKCGDCAKKDGCCEGKGERADGKGCCGKCKEGKKDAAPAEAKPAPAPTEAPAPTAKP